MNDGLTYELPGGQQIQFTPYRIGGRNGASAVVTGNGSIEAEGFVTGSTGWKINGDGSVEFNNGTFRGDLDAAGGTFSGDLTAAGGTFAGDISAATGTFTGAIEASSIDIGGNDSTSFHVDSAGNLWLGAASYAAAPFKVSSTGALVATDGTFTGTLTGTIDASAATINSPTMSNPDVTNGTFDGIDVDGSATIITGGQLASDNYVAGVSGWAIDGDGDAEFNDVTARGRLITGPDGAQIADGLRFTYVNNNTVAGTEWVGPDPVGTGNPSYIGQYTDQALVGVAWDAYIEMLADSVYVRARNGITFDGPSKVVGDLTVGVDADMFIGDWPLGSYEGMMHSDLASSYMIMSNGTDTFIGSDSSTYIRPTGNSGGSFRFFKSGATLFLDGGGCVIQNVNEIRVTDGSRTDPSYTFTNDSDVGMYRPSTNQLSFATGGVEKFNLRTNDHYLRWVGNRYQAWQSDGNVVIYNGGTVVWSSGTSDERLKENIEDVDGDDALALIRQLRPVTYEWKDETGYADDEFDRYYKGERHWGFIGQEVDQVFRQAVRIIESPTLDDLHLIDKEEMVPMLVAALQSLSDQVADMELRLSLM